MAVKRAKPLRYAFGEFRISSLRDRVPPAAACDNPAKLFNYWHANIPASPAYQPDKELFVVVLFNTKLDAIGWHLVSLGTLNETSAHPREILRPVLIGAAYAFAMMHNHPSGDPTPSDADRRLTRRLREAGELVGVPLIDHVIVGTSAEHRPQPFFSFKEAGML